MTTSANGKSSTRSKNTRLDKDKKFLYIYDQTKKHNNNSPAHLLNRRTEILGSFSMGICMGCVFAYMWCFYTCKDCKNSIRKSSSFPFPSYASSVAPAGILQSRPCFQKEQIPSISSSTSSNITAFTNGFFASTCKSLQRRRVSMIGEESMSRAFEPAHNMT
jgi:hypothetical protein